MKIYKFRWYDENGLPVFKTFAVPNNGGILIGSDCDGRKVFEGDLIQGEDGKIGHASLDAQTFINRFKLVENAR